MELRGGGGNWNVKTNIVVMKDAMSGPQAICSSRSKRSSCIPLRQPGNKFCPSTDPTKDEAVTRTELVASKASGRDSSYKRGIGSIDQIT